MTLAQLISIMEGVALQQPSVNMVVQNDIYKINSAPSLMYGIFGWTQGQHSGSVTGMQTYQFTLFYVDRLTEDQSNLIEVQSVGCETLGNILRSLDVYDIDVQDYTIQPFSQRFTDECAGVFVTVSLSVLPTSVCFEEFADVTDKIIY